MNFPPMEFSADGFETLDFLPDVHYMSQWNEGPALLEALINGAPTLDPQAVNLPTHGDVDADGEDADADGGVAPPEDFESTFRVPAGPEHEGFCTRAQVQDLIVNIYRGALSPKKQNKCLVTESRLNEIYQVLGPRRGDATFQDPQFRFWVRSTFYLPEENTGPHDVLKQPPRSSRRSQPDGQPDLTAMQKIVTAEQIFDTLTWAHRESGHGGRDKTGGIARAGVYGLPKDIVSHYVASCPTCMAKRERKGTNAATNVNRRKRKAEEQPEGGTSTSAPRKKCAPSRAKTTATATTTTTTTTAAAPAPGPATMTLDATATADSPRPVDLPCPAPIPSAFEAPVPVPGQTGPSHGQGGEEASSAGITQGESAMPGVAGPNDLSPTSCLSPLETLMGPAACYQEEFVGGWSSMDVVDLLALDMGAEPESWVVEALPMSPVATTTTTTTTTTGEPGSLGYPTGADHPSEPQYDLDDLFEWNGEEDEDEEL
ncbi:MAG: hypothetical protein M1823_004606 [Watsoniomyces obsoletus]|nr:MAG: hypothetical protein M1823_004606 [Watsoniomyces obsoletus]